MSKISDALDEVERDTIAAAEKGGDFAEGAEWVIARMRFALEPTASTSKITPKADVLSRMGGDPRRGHEVSRVSTRYSDREQANLDAGLQANGQPFPQAPVREVGSSHDDYIETHPAYAMIGAQRWTGNAVLTGTDFNHRNFITITVRRARLARSLSSDHFYGDDELISVHLSEAQWASFVSTMNVGDGVPATLRYYGPEGHVPQIVRITDRREQIHGEMADTLQDALRLMKEVHDAAPTKALREKARQAIQEIEANMPFVAERFERQTEKVVEHAKIEVDAWMTATVQRAGLQALGGNEPPIELSEGVTSTWGDGTPVID